VLNVFNRYFSAGELDEVVAAFQGGLAVVVSDSMPSDEYVKQIAAVKPLLGAVRKLGATEPASVAGAAEFVLEGLHLSKKLNKDSQAGRFRYKS